VEWKGKESDLDIHLPSYLSLKNTLKSNGTYKTLFQIQSGHTPNDLLKFLINDINLVGLRELLPSMDEIFIKSVNASSKSANNE
jgi:ABC-2 type transport system ATP-binding protein